MDFLGLLVPFTGAISILVALAILIAGKADRDRGAVQTAQGSEFTPNRRSYWGVYGFIALFGLGAIVSLVTNRGANGSVAAASIAVGFVLLLLMAFPATIVVNEHGLEQLFWLRGRKRIAWGDVSAVDANEKKGTVKITGKNGVTIIHTRQLPDRPTFLTEVGKHQTETAPAPVEAPVLAMSGPAA